MGGGGEGGERGVLNKPPTIVCGKTNASFSLFLCPILDLIGVGGGLVNLLMQ